MRKSLLLPIIILQFFYLPAQVVNIPDANFKNALLTHSPVIDLNGDGQIQVTEAVAFTGTMNVASKNIADMTGVEAFTNMINLNCQQNQITVLPITSLNALQNLYCSYNNLSSLTVGSLPSLKTLYCEKNFLTTITLGSLPALSELRIDYNNFTSLAINNLPSLIIFDCYNNQLTSLSLTNVNSLVGLGCSANQLSSLPLNNLPALRILDCSYNQFTVLPLSNLNSLTFLDCSYNQLSSISLPNPGILTDLGCAHNMISSLPAGLNSLKILLCSYNQISSLSLNNYASLTFLDFGNNLCTNFSLTNKPLLTDIYCKTNQLNSLALSNLPALKNLHCDSNQLGSLSLTNFPALYDVSCDVDQLNSLTLSNLPSLWRLYCLYNKISSLTINNFPSLTRLYCDYNQLTALNISNSPALYDISCSNNQLSSLNLPALPALNNLYIEYNQLTTFSLDNCPALRYLTCNNNLLTSLSLTNLPMLGNLQCARNRFTSFSIGNLPSLYALTCGCRTLTSVSLANNLPLLDNFWCDSSQLLTTLDLSQVPVRHFNTRGDSLLSYINIKNGAISSNMGNLFLPPGLQDICVDDAEMTYINSLVASQLPGQNVVVSSFCSFNPGGNYNTIVGTVRFDETANGCNNLDSTMNFVKINITDGTQSGSTFTNNMGYYKFYAQLSPDTVTASFPTNWFTITPPSQIINFSGYGNTAVADFCVKANGIHHDLDIVLIPILRATPGHFARYHLVYSNKGNQTESGTITLGFNDIKLVFSSAAPNPSGQSAGNLSWTYSNLRPYQTRTIDIFFLVNPPPVTNIGDQLLFVAVINPIPGDETPTDNTDSVWQTVKSSWDPNDKEVTEGSQIAITKAGDYLHYVIHFQNTGNANATSVIVKDSLSANLDWTTLFPLSSSHPCRTVISKGNLVQFIFDGINLPPKSVNEPASNGFVSFKIKPKSNLIIGDTLKNTANIYFDFNQAIVTNTVYTVIIKPDVGAGSGNLTPIGLTVYPNPVNSTINFFVKAGGEIKSIRLFNGFGQQVNFVIKESTGLYRKLDISGLPPGFYVLEVFTAKGRDWQKLIKSN